MKAGDYVRTDIGEIRKVVRVTDDLYVLDKDIVFAHKDKIKKSSPNIIDLIEVGDYVNGLPVECVEGTWDDENDKRVYYGVATYGHKSNLPYHTYIVKDEFENDYDLKFRCIKPNEIKSIITKEQFSQMEYKVGK